MGSRPDLCSLPRRGLPDGKRAAWEGRARKALCKVVPIVSSARDHRGSVLPID